MLSFNQVMFILILITILSITLYIYIFLKVRNFLNDQRNLNEQYVSKIYEKYEEMQDDVNDEQQQ